MARARGRSRQNPPIRPPRTSFHFLAVTVGVFVAFNVGLLVFFQKKKHPFQGERYSKKKGTIVSQQRSSLFDSPEKVPDQVIADLDAILVLGGGVPSSLNEPPVFVQRRCDDAATVVQRHNTLSTTTSKELAVLCLSAGTAHLPQLMGPNDGLPIWESTASAAYLIQHYSPTLLAPQQIYVETTSYDTIGNAFYARTSFTDITGWRNLLVVTSEFHMNRTQAIFDWIFEIMTEAQSSTKPYQLHYLMSPNVGLTEEAVRARKEREAKSLHSVQNHLAPKLQSMRQVWAFLTHDHSLYTASTLVERGTQKGTTTTTATTIEEEETNSNQAALRESYGGGKGNIKSQEDDKELRD